MELRCKAIRERRNRGWEKWSPRQGRKEQVVRTVLESKKENSNSLRKSEVLIKVKGWAQGRWK